ncbi:MAG: glycine zipper domain-containing protein [Phycisphaerales bacterium]
MNRVVTRSRRSAFVMLLALAGVGLGSTGCNNAGEGALSGAGLGALAGLGIGSLTGSAGAGAAIGAIAGGVGGAVIGDQNERKERHRSNDW